MNYPPANVITLVFWKRFGEVITASKGLAI